MSENNPHIALIVAVATNGAIGRNNQLLWHLPNDLQYFKATTMGKPIVMGRKTYESIGRPLPGRTNIVISRQFDETTPAVKEGGIKLASNLEQGIEIAKAQAMIDGVDEVMVIGGGEMYRAALPKATLLYLTRVDADIEGDSYFTFEETEWKEVKREDFKACDKNPYDYSFCVLERR